MTLASGALGAYLRPMSRFSRYNPLAGLRDLRLFLHSRQKHELVFAFLAVLATLVVIFGFLIDARDLKAPYKRDIQYVQSWPLNRTDADLREIVDRVLDAQKPQKLASLRNIFCKLVIPSLTFGNE